MSLAPAEQQVLAEIECRLRRSDPALAARLALFRRHAGRGRGPARERLSPWRARRPRAVNAMAVLLAAIVLAILAIGLVAAFIGHPHRAAAAIRGIDAVRHHAQPLCCPAGSRAPSAAASLCISARVTAVSPVTSR